MREIHVIPARAVTHGPRHHFFGYYDKSPWDATGRYMLALEAPFGDREPDSADRATVGVIDLGAGCSFHPMADTTAWNWQQGAMLQWLPSAPERLIIFNDRRDGAFVSVVMDIRNAEARVLPRPIYAISRDGARALTVNFSRLNDWRPGYGYAGVPDPWEDDPQPDDDGIYVMDLATGESRLILSLAQVVAHRHEKRMEGLHHWFNHLQFNTDDSRFVFLHRWPREKGGRYTRMLTAAPDGSGLYCLSDHDMTSHFDWRNERQILAWATRREVGDRFFLFDDRTARFEAIGDGVLTEDGHCSYSPDGRWILTDTYPDRENMRALMLYRDRREATSPAEAGLPSPRRRDAAPTCDDEGVRVDIGRFYAPPELPTPARCDLHPRWSRAPAKRVGRHVCIDSAHEGTRQMYVLEVTEVVRRA